MGSAILWGVAGASLLGGAIGTAMAALAWRYRDRPAMSAFGWLMVVCAVWAFLEAMRMLTSDLSTVYALDRLVRLASSSTAPLVLVFVLAYTGNDDSLRPSVVGALWLVPISYGVLSLTAPVHGLTSGVEAAHFVTQHGITVGVVTGDLASAVEAVYGYVLLLIAFGLLFRFLLRSRAIYRRQAAIVAIGTLLPVAVDLAEMIIVTNHPGVDLTPASLGIMGLILGWGLFRYDFHDVTPMASDMLVSELPDPVVVLDEDGLVLDHNRAAATAFGKHRLGGRSINEVAPGLPTHFDGNSVYTYSHLDTDEITYFDPRVTVVEDQHDIERGRLVVLRDVTGQQRRQDRLEALQAATQQFITAESDERIADLAVTFSERVLDQDAASVFLYDEHTDALHLTAASEAIERAFPDDARVVEDPDHPVYDAYHGGSITVTDVSDRHPGSPFPALMLVPIGDYGLLLIGSRETGGFVTEDEQFATILARTTQVALSQIERERELRRSRQAIERRNEQVEFFDGVLRHTLRNALLVMQGRADHLRDHVDETRERHLDRIVQWCTDLSELSEEIEAINDTVRATEARQLDTVDLAVVLRDCLDRSTGDFEDATIDLTIGDDLTVLANDLVEKVFDSVVSNAVTHNDAPEPRVEISARRIADRVQVRVADNGPGMTDEMKESVFERNVATSQTSRGFGLYFVSVMMNLYGGTVWIEDNDVHRNGERCGAVAVLEFKQAETQHTSQSAENEPV